jgi:hypothetical protein
MFKMMSVNGGLMEGAFPSLGGRVSSKISEIIRLPSNHAALEATKRFGEGKISNLVLLGPSGWGKTCILEYARAILMETGNYKRVSIINAQDFVVPRHDYDPNEPILLDNFQDVMQLPKRRLTIRMALERRLKAKNPTMIAITSPKGVLPRGILPNQYSWLVTKVGIPTFAERKVLVKHLSSAYDLKISDQMVAFLAAKLAGNGAAVEGALKRLRIAGTDWQSPEATLRGCGVLVPFLLDDGAWDFRSFLQETVSKVSEADSQNFTIHLMRNVAQIQEADVATFLEMTPTAVHRTARKFAERLKNDPRAKEMEKRCVALSIERLGQA